MNSRIKSEFLGLNGEQKLLVLGSLIHSMTVTMRAHMDGEGAVSPSDLRAINDAIHVTSSHLMDKLSGTNYYPDDTFMDLLLEIAESAFENELAWHWHRAIAHHAVQHASS